MKKLLISVIFTIVAFASNAQVFVFQSFQVQEITIPDISRDSVFHEKRDFISTYIFDLSENTITSSIDGIIYKASIIIYDQYIFLTYVDFPSAIYTINLNEKTMVFLEINLDNQTEYHFPNAILTKL
jgi:ABC-type multidrug transport system permease subunit